MDGRPLTVCEGALFLMPTQRIQSYDCMPKQYQLWLTQQFLWRDF